MEYQGTNDEQITVLRRHEADLVRAQEALPTFHVDLVYDGHAAVFTARLDPDSTGILVQAPDVDALIQRTRDLQGMLTRATRLDRVAVESYDLVGRLFEVMDSRGQFLVPDDDIEATRQWLLNHPVRRERAKKSRESTVSPEWYRERLAEAERANNQQDFGQWLAEAMTAFPDSDWLEVIANPNIERREPGELHLVPDPRQMPLPITMATHDRDVARAYGFEGDACEQCGQFQMVRNGACMKCMNCGESSGCS